MGKLQLDDALLSQLADGVDSGPLDAGLEEFHEAEGLGVLGYRRPGLVDAAGSTCKANQYGLGGAALVGVEGDGVVAGLDNLLDEGAFQIQLLQNQVYFLPVEGHAS